MVDATLCVRGDSLNARFSKGRNTPGFFTDTSGVRPIVVNAALPGMIGSYYIDAYRGGANARCGLVYDGANLYDSLAWSLVFRGARQTGGDMGMFGTATISGELQGALTFYRANSTVTSLGTLRNDQGQEMRDQQILAYDSLLSVFHDWTITCTGTTAGLGLSIYRDAVLVGNYALETNGNVVKDKNLSLIALGFTLNVVRGGWFIEEFLMANGIIDPLNVQLTSGMGALTGPTRTAFVDVPVFNGSLSTDPGTFNVANGTNYQIAGVSKVGTLNTVTNVLQAATLTGQSLKATLKGQ